LPIVRLNSPRSCNVMVHVRHHLCHLSGMFRAVVDDCMVHVVFIPFEWTQIRDMQKCLWACEPTQGGSELQPCYTVLLGRRVTRWCR